MSNFWDRNEHGHDLDDLIKIQAKRFVLVDPDYSVEYPQTIKRKDARTALRIAKVKNYLTAEYTGFIEFTNFIFFCVMFSPENRIKMNAKKLENILKIGCAPLKCSNKNFLI